MTFCKPLSVRRVHSERRDCGCTTIYQLGRRSDRREMHIEIFEAGYFPRLLRIDVVSPDIRSLIHAAVGEKIHSVVVPHRELVVSRVVGDIHGGPFLKIVDPDVGSHPAAISFPGPVRSRYRSEGDLVPVGRNCPELSVREGKFLRHSTFRRHPVKLIESLPAAFHCRSEQHALTVRIPGENPVRVAVVRDSQRHPAF